MPWGGSLHPEVTLTSKELDGLVQADAFHKMTPIQDSGR